jgi:hypothetical protein
MRCALLMGALGYVFLAHSQTVTDRAIRYNDALVERQVEAGQLMQLFGEQLQKNQIRQAEKTLEEIQNTLQQHLKALETTPPFEGETALRDALTELFRLYRSVAQNEYQAILAEYRSAEVTGKLQKERVQKILDDIKNREAQADAVFLGKQKEFAARYGFALKTNKLEAGNFQDSKRP